MMLNIQQISPRKCHQSLKTRKKKKEKKRYLFILFIMILPFTNHNYYHINLQNVM